MSIHLAHHVTPTILTRLGARRFKGSCTLLGDAVDGLPEGIGDTLAVLTSSGPHGREVVAEGPLSQIVATLSRFGIRETKNMLIALPERSRPPFRFDDSQFGALLRALAGRGRPAPDVEHAVPKQRIANAWSEEDIAKLRALAAAGKSRQEIANALGRSEDSIATRAIRLKVRIAGSFQRKRGVRRY